MIRSLIVSLVCAISVGAQDKQSDFCASRTSEAYHSASCNWGFVVHDPNIIKNLPIPHKPAYHTYSRWMLNNENYILAYRDIDDQPQEMAVDIYLAKNGDAFQHIGTARIPGLVTDVSIARLTGETPDFLFHLQSGELTWLEVVRIFNRKAKEVFWYGASQIDVSPDPNPMIVAKSRLANTVEQFVWDSRSKRFKKVRQYTWHNDS
jgi:hypothetical protein